MIDQRSAAGAFALALFVAGNLVQPAAAQPADESNWMRDFVTSRVAAQNLRAMGTEAPGVSGEELMSLVQPRIVGGTVAGAGDNPFQVALLRASQPNNAAAQFCGGTLVRPNMVVTAAHCSDFITAPQVQVLTGTQLLDGSGTRRNVARIAIHPSWNSNTFDNDVAVWELTTDAPGPARHARHRERPGRRRPPRHRLGHADRGRLEPDRPPPRRRAARRHRRLQRRQLLQRLDPAQHDLRRADPGRPRQLPGRLGRPADPRAGQRHPDRHRQLGQRLRPAEPLRRLHPGVEPDHPQLHRANHRPAIHGRHLQPRRGYAIPNGLWLPADLNGDGKADIVHAVQDSDYVHTWMSNGDGTFAVGTFSPGAGYAIPNGLWLPMDVNGDGKTDIVHAVENSNYVHTWMSNGDGTFASAPSAPAPATRSRTGSGCRRT